MGKGEIARDEQFLLFPQCFQNTYTADTSKPGLVWERVNSTKRHNFNASTDDKFGVAEIMGFVFERVENIEGKGENAGDQHFLLFLQCFQKAFSLGC